LASHDIDAPQAAATLVQPEICYALNYVARLLEHSISAKLAELGVSIGQLPILLALYQSEDLTQVELARAAGVEQPTIADALPRMERNGLITRSIDAKDRRRSQLRLTDHAKAIEPAVQRLRAEIDADALDGVSPDDQQDFQRVLSRIIQNLS
jgi:DNA-binding MarR family transcriptional regulator